MYDKFTSDQKNAVNAKGAVIVTAAAGSGKTAVLTERVIDRIINGNLSADRLLIVTFTNLAAAEMKSRIEKRLFEECEKAPQNIHLLKQRLLISSADICTIDSFCIKLLRNNFSKLGISPDFKIADNTTEDLIAKKVMSEIFKEYYEKKSEDFYEFLKSTDSIYSDENAVNRVLELYNKVMSLPFYRDRLDLMLEEYNPENILNSKWIRYLFSAVSQKFTELFNSLSSQKDILKTDEKAYSTIGPSVEEYLNYFSCCKALAEKNDYDGLKATIINPPQKPSFRSKFEIDIKNRFKAIFEIIYDVIESFLPIFSMPKEEMIEEAFWCQRIARQLISLCKEFDERFFAELTKRGYLTFQISEQLAFNLLCENKDGAYVPSQFSKEVTDFYEEVMVDEYQDVNFLQNMLFYILSNMGSKLFVVGDAKQSIYGFRNANPEFFIKKSENAALYSEEIEKDILKRVVLSANFRSRKGICDFVNGFFSLAMSEKFGGMKYDQNEMLNPKADFIENGEDEVEIHLTENAADAPCEIAKYILKCIQKPLMLNDKDEHGNLILRPATFGDFAVLFRASTKFSKYYDALSSYKIPVSISDGNFFETSEIKCITSFLTAINSPMNDTAMLSVLLSPVFQFTADEVAHLKAGDKKERLFKLLNQNKSGGDIKIERFLNVFGIYRQKAAYLKIADLISFILAHSELKNYFSALPDGERRVNNLLYFEQLAADFSGEGISDLSEFLNHIKFLEQKGEIKSSGTANENSVKLLTMHKSKGLQFPVVIVAESAANFSIQSTLDDLSVDENLGLAFTRIDDEKSVKYISTPKKIMNMHITQRSREEELRLLYVVMTRAEEKLVFFIHNSSEPSSPFNAAAAKLLCFSDADGISPMAFLSSKNSAVWVSMYALLLQGFAELRNRYGIGDEIIPTKIKELEVNAKCIQCSVAEGEVGSQEKNLEAEDAQPIYMHDLGEIFEYKYPFEKLRSIEAKTSVSSLVKEKSDFEYIANSRPAFMSGEGLTPTERGTALHKFMQYADFKRVKADVNAELERLYEYEFLSEAEARSIDVEKINKFTCTEIFERMVSSEKVLKEQRFLLSVPAVELEKDLDYALWKQEVIVQGAIDCMFFENGEIVLIDFKTDRTSDENELISHYFEQLKIYSIAAQKMFSKKVKECYIYSLNMGKWIKVPL